ncbi:MAG: transposase [Candidatus Moranbacteria bacterium]|nr:transposase [Candidatus Moranbacteria bacterium]
MRRRIPLEIGEYYHLYNRGVEKRDIFLDEHDYRRFLALLYLCNGVEIVNMQRLKMEDVSYQEIFSLDRGEPLVAIGAYCLMPNHFHLLVKEVKEGGISLFMKKLLTAYAMYMNKRHERSGVLFQGRFKSEHVFTDNYFKYLYSYIHLNPLKLIDPDWQNRKSKPLSEAAEYLGGYPYSSYESYLNADTLESAILNRGEFPDYFSDRGSFKKFHEYWMTYNSIKDRPL